VEPLSLAAAHDLAESAAVAGGCSAREREEATRLEQRQQRRRDALETTRARAGAERCEHECGAAPVAVERSHVLRFRRARRERERAAAERRRRVQQFAAVQLRHEHELARVAVVRDRGAGELARERICAARAFEAPDSEWLLLRQLHHAREFVLH